MKLNRRGWIMIGAAAAVVVTAGAVALTAGLMSANADAEALATYEAAVADVKSAAQARDTAAEAHSELIEAAVTTHQAGTALVAATDPALLADPATRDTLGAELAGLADAAGLTIAEDGSVTRSKASDAPDVAIPLVPPEGRESHLAKADVLRAAIPSMKKSHTSITAQSRRVTKALDQVEAAAKALIASAHAKGAAPAAPELASQETKDAYAAAVTALEAPAPDADLVELLGSYQTAWTAASASHDEAVKARDAARAPDTPGGGDSVQPTYIRGILVVNKTYRLPSWYGDGLTGETWGAFNAMKAEAASLGLNLYISSGFRSYWDQRAIYNRYVANDGQAAADRYSARPGHSEHQSGFTFDLNSIDESFAYTAEGQWVRDNAHRFGFVIRYPQGKEAITGYIWEPWHLRYLGVAVATELHYSGLTLEEYLGITSQYAN